MAILFHMFAYSLCFLRTTIVCIVSVCNRSISIKKKNIKYNIFKKIIIYTFYLNEKINIRNCVWGKWCEKTILYRIDQESIKNIQDTPSQKSLQSKSSSTESLKVVTIGN